MCCSAVQHKKGVNHIHVDESHKGTSKAWKNMSRMRPCISRVRQRAKNYHLWRKTICCESVKGSTEVKIPTCRTVAAVADGKEEDGGEQKGASGVRMTTQMLLLTKVFHCLNSYDLLYKITCLYNKRVCSMYSSETWK